MFHTKLSRLSRAVAAAGAITMLSATADVAGPAWAAKIQSGQACSKAKLKSGTFTCVVKAGRLVWTATPAPKKTTRRSPPTTKRVTVAAARRPATAKPGTVTTKGKTPALSNQPIPTVTTKPGDGPSVPAPQPAPAPAPVAAPVSPTVNGPTLPPSIAPTVPVSPSPSPSPSSSSPSTAPPSNPGSSLDGVWKTNSGEVGYRVKQTVSGQNIEAVGRTKSVTGTMTMESTMLKSVEMNVALTTLKSDDAKRDSGVQNLLKTNVFPTATISLAAPFNIGEIPPDKVEITKTPTFRLTLAGVTRDVPIAIKARRNGATVEIVGSTTIKFDDYGIADPGRPPLLISEDRGVVEFLVVFGR